MTTEPITCSGNDLYAVCADLKSRKCVAWKLETKIGGHNAMYRVSYFERIGETEVRGTPPVGQTPNALNHLPKPKHSKNVAAGGETRAEKPKSAMRAPASILERGDRTIESNDSTKDKQQASKNHFGKVATVRGLLLSDAGSARNAMTRKPSSVCAEPAALYSSIEDRMAALQSKLLASGKIKRSKPKTMPDNYRSPYAD